MRSLLGMTRGRILALVGLLLVAYLGLLVFQVVQNNYRLSKQIDSLGKQITKLESDNEQLAYEVQYFQTDSFKEKEARAKFGLMAPGEGVIVLAPKKTANAPATATAVKPKASNPRQWWQFLFG